MFAHNFLKGSHIAQEKLTGSININCFFPWTNYLSFYSTYYFQMFKRQINIKSWFNSQQKTLSFTVWKWLSSDRTASQLGKLKKPIIAYHHSFVCFFWEFHCINCCLPHWFFLTFLFSHWLSFPRYLMVNYSLFFQLSRKTMFALL